jgi:hypothetical protein
VPPKRHAHVCEWINLRRALSIFVLNETGHQGQDHIRPLHWYSACRLVVEGGFLPDEITPRPPFRVEQLRGRKNILVYDSSSAGGGEQTVLGGLKTKNVDVVVNKYGIGPCIAVSHKGVLGAFRNLTNRMEEAVGDCTNIHITYPALVYGYLVAIRANRRSNLGDPVVKLPASDDADASDEGGGELTSPSQVPEESEPTTEAALAAGGELVNSIESGDINTADLAIREGGEPAAMIARFHQAMRELTGRRGIRNDASRYEAIAIVLADPAAGASGELLTAFPSTESPLRFERFFAQIYTLYDERYVYGAPDLKTVTRRLEWSQQSPALRDELASALDYQPRLAAER